MLVCVQSRSGSLHKKLDNIDLTWENWVAGKQKKDFSLYNFFVTFGFLFVGKIALIKKN